MKKKKNPPENKNFYEKYPFLYKKITCFYKIQKSAAKTGIFFEQLPLTRPHNYWCQAL